MFAQQWILMGSVSGFVGVVLGAFGGHVLKEMLSEKAFSIYLVGVQYQMYHAFALLALGLWAAQNPNIDTKYPGSAFTLGIILFSGSLYILALTNQKWLGMVTPLGGVSFLAGWIGFAFLCWRA